MALEVPVREWWPESCFGPLMGCLMALVRVWCRVYLPNSHDRSHNLQRHIPSEVRTIYYALLLKFSSYSVMPFWGPSL